MLAIVTTAETATPQDDQPTFSDFWLLYPKRVAKLDAEKAWKRMSPADRVAALVGLVTWRAVWIAEGRLQFVPHAATWLNAQRWTDELPDSWGASHASHVAANLPETERKRTELPDHVKQAIARLRK